MPLTDQNITDLQAIHRSGKKIHVCEYIEVQWDADDANETRYYANSKWDKIPPFVNIGLDIEARLLNEPFRTMELYPDLRTETIPLVFDDIDKTIRGKFQGFGSGVRVEFFLYYPQVDAHHSLWFGQLQAPQVYGWKRVQTVATNGFRSREQYVPKRLRPRECSWTFGGHLTAEALETNGCKYDRHLGGSVGNYRTGTTPYNECPRDETACAARGMTAYYGGYKPDASAVVTDHKSGYLAVSKGNASALRDPIRVVFGTKTVRANQLLFWRREMNAKHQDKGWVAGVWEVCEGPIRSIRNIKVGEKVIEQMHIGTRTGTPAQTALTQYAPDIGRFSNVAHYFARKGWVDPLTENAQTLVSECAVEGYDQVTSLNVTAAGHGLLGSYHSGTTWSSLMGTRIDPQINFPRSYYSPFAGLLGVNFSVRWTGTITFPYTETFTISAEHDNGVKVVINGSTVIDQLAATGTHTGNFAATADTAYTIQVDFLQANSVGAQPWYCILEWSSASQAAEVIPSSAFNHTGTSGHSRQWSNNRVWCLLELMHNQRFGMSYPLARFNGESWTDAASHSAQTVTFSYTNSDGETRSYIHQRTLLDVVLEGRPVAEQIVDICRSGRVSVPYQKNGEFHIQPFRAFTDAELAAAPVFTDTGASQNVLWANGAPNIQISQTPDDKIINEITLLFEDGSHNDQERPITVDNPNQKLKAGRVLGEGNMQSVPTRYAALGVRNLNEAVKLGYGTLRFGEFDEGGILNNLTVTLEVPLVEALAAERYGVIKIVSELIDGFLLPTDDLFSAFAQAEYFRVLKIVKTSRDTAEITAQVYNHTAYEALEGTVTAYPPTRPPDSPRPDTSPIPVLRARKAILEGLDYNYNDKVLTLTASVV